MDYKDDTQERIVSVITEYQPKFEAITETQHLLCPRDDYEEETVHLDDADGNDAVEERRKRLAEAEDRRNTTFHLSLMLSLPEEKIGMWKAEYKERVTSCLQACDDCARNWYQYRQPFLDSLGHKFHEVIVGTIKDAIILFNDERITRGLSVAYELLSTQGPMSASKLAALDMTALLALFEALCDPTYLMDEKHGEVFSYVFEKMQQKKPLKMAAGIIPSMTMFLFQRDTYRNKYARTGWENMAEDSLTHLVWDWAVHEHLKKAMKEAWSGNGPMDQERICLFWRGFVAILRTMGVERVQDCLRPMEQSVWFLALEHLPVTTSADALALVMAGLRALMEKSPKTFWDALDQVPPTVLADCVMNKSPAFRVYLDKSLYAPRLDDVYATPTLAQWATALFKSLPMARRSDPCEVLLHQLLVHFGGDASCSPEAKASCVLTGCEVLLENLQGYLRPGPKFDSTTSLIVVNQLLSYVVKYKDMIIMAASMKDTDQLNFGISRAAMAVVHSSLSLDAKATWVEWNAINDQEAVQNTVNRDSGALWESFLEMLYGGRVELAQSMLMATMALRCIERFIPARKGSLSAEKLRFNQRYEQQTIAVSKILGRLTDFSEPHLRLLCTDKAVPTIHPIVASLMHGEEPIRDAGQEVIKAIAGEAALGDAVHKMLDGYFGDFLDAFTAAMVTLTVDKDSNNPWSPMPAVMKCNELVLAGLCDNSVGLLRSKPLSAHELDLVKRWWKVSWQCVDYALKNLRSWHERVAKNIMESFARDTMELAEKLLAQDGLLSSVLNRGDELTAAMREVLGAPREHLYGLVEMLQLRDKYLIQGVVGVLGKVLTRMRDNKMGLPKRDTNHLLNMCRKRSVNGIDQYMTKTNLDDFQRTVLLKALSGEYDDEVRCAESRPRDRLLMRQSRLDLRPAGSSAQSAKAERGAKTLLETVQAGPAAKAAKAGEKAFLASSSAFKEKRAKDKAEQERLRAQRIAQAKAGYGLAVPGDGSGLKAVAGVLGKDEAVAAQKQEIMVGDSSSSSSDGDSEDELATRDAATKTAGEAQTPPPLGKQHGPVKKTRLQRSAKDMRARLIPPMDVLHQALLEWDLFHQGDDPPNGYRCLEVSAQYANPQDYKQTFFPLLINEAWRSFVRDKGETANKAFGIKVLNRMSVDRFLEVTTLMPLDRKSNDRRVGEGDIVLLSQGGDPLSQPHELHCLARTWKTQVKKDALEVVYRLSGKNNQMLPVLLPGAQFWAVKITNMTTIEREYAALESLQYYDLMDEILQAEPSPMLTFGNDRLQSVMDNWRLNAGQAKALLNAKENDGFTLVQGPPGTGKTKTIVAMVGCLLTATLKAASNAAGLVALSKAGAAKTQGPAKKLLVCAPSNAAVDEIVLRLKDGVKTMHGTAHKIKVVRLGRGDVIHAAVRDVTLEQLVAERIKVELGKQSIGSDRDKMHEEAGQIKAKLAELRPVLEASRDGDDRALTSRLQRDFDDLKRCQAHVGARIDADKSSGNTHAREVEIKRRQVQQDILDQSQVLCATLSGSGHEMFRNLNVEFETVVIDEAAQCVELSALIPLKYGCSKCILVGDPKQLPPTVLSQSAARYGYDQSLFVRMQKKHAKHVHLLDRQYRMHPEISMFPSCEFYEGLLRDGDDMARLRRQPWHQSELLGPYRFFDVAGSQTRGVSGQSLVNEEEIKVALRLYERFRFDYRDPGLGHKMGIITPYKAQLYQLQNRFAQRYGDAIKEQIEFNTTDAFQGRECDIIIFSCVRASVAGGIGFMTDIRRMNVGLTRAKSSLWILGDSRALVQGAFWNKLIEDAKRRDRYTQGDILAMLSRPSLPDLGHGAATAKAEKPDLVMPDAPSSAAARSEYAPLHMSPPASAARLPIQQASKSTQRARFAGSGAAMSPPPLPVPRDYRDMGRPPIRQASGRKRPHDDSTGHGPDVKKVHQQQAYRNGPPPQLPSGPRALQSKPPPTDPSAMEVLGLVAPVRAPPPWSSYGGLAPAGDPPQHGGLAGNGGPPRRPQNMPPRKKEADPFIRKKPAKR